MSAWRVIITDTESPTGVAPVCGSSEHDREGEGLLSAWVLDCCPHPHIELWSEPSALAVAMRLTACDAEACS